MPDGVGEWIWVWFALLAAISQAGLALVNEFFKVSPIGMLFWMRAICLCFLFPVVFLVDLPTDPFYYLFVFIGALIFAYSDLVRFGVVAKSGAGIVTRLDPLAVAITFVVWTALSPALFFSYLAEPLRAGGIVVSLIGCVYFALRLRKCEISYEALRHMAPALLLSAVGIITGKFAMMHASLLNGVIGYVFFQSFIVLSVYIIALNIPSIANRLPHRDMLCRSLKEKIVLLAGGSMAIAWLFHTPSKWMAISLVENPAYVTMIGLSAPLWVILLYKAIGRRDENDVYSSLGIVFCIAMLVVFTQF